MRNYKKSSNISLVSGRINKVWILGLTEDHIWIKINYNHSTIVYNNSDCTVHSAVHSEVLKLIER